MGKVVDLANVRARRQWAAIIERFRAEQALIQSGRPLQLEATEQRPALQIVARNDDIPYGDWLSRRHTPPPSRRPWARR